MKAYGSGCIDPHFLDLGTGTHWTRGWVDLRARLDDLEKRKFLTLPGLELRPLSHPARSFSIPSFFFVADKNSVVLSMLANYTDRAIAAGQRS
jgi:hypothetical protein